MQSPDDSPSKESQEANGSLSPNPSPGKMGAAAPRFKQLKIAEPITTTTEDEANSNSPRPEIQIDDEQDEELLAAKELKGVLKKTAKRNIE